MSSENRFYKNAAIYWSNVPATIDGILGGFGNISDIDIEGSKAFLERILSRDQPPGTKLALDCGAGIGRVSKNLLIHYFDEVDLVEQDDRFISTAKQSIGKVCAKLGTAYKIGLQHFKPQKKYNVIWCQWVLGHLTDYDLISFLMRCSHSLASNGVIVIKENITTTNEIEYDEEDSSVTRPLALMEKLINEAQLNVISTEVQSGFPDEIYPVHMFALAPMQKVFIV